MEFKIKGKDRKYKKIEEMDNELKGIITKDKTITIQWEWKYETHKIQDLQDTKDGINIKKYNFAIWVIGQ